MGEDGVKETPEYEFTVFGHSGFMRTGQELFVVCAGKKIGKMSVYIPFGHFLF